MALGVFPRHYRSSAKSKMKVMWTELLERTDNAPVLVETGLEREHSLGCIAFILGPHRLCSGITSGSLMGPYRVPVMVPRLALLVNILSTTLSLQPWMRSLDFPQVLNLRTLLIPRVKLANYPRLLQSSKAYLDFPLNPVHKDLVLQGTICHLSDFLCQDHQGTNRCEAPSGWPCLRLPLNHHFKVWLP